MSTFPSVVTTLTNPNATDRLNAPSHSSIHGAVNGEIQQIETFVGTLSSAVGTLVYDIRAAASNGGGHVQSANKGGTGQTGYTKGDIIVATSSSVLARLSVTSTAGQVLTADSTQAAGMKWAAAAPSNRIYSATSVVSLSGGAGSVETVLYAASIVGSTLSAQTAIRYTAWVDTLGLSTSKTFTARVKYGNNTINTVVLQANLTSVVGAAGTIEGFIVGKAGTSSQLGSGKSFVGSQFQGTAINPLYGYSGNSTSSVESSANQDLIITGQFGDGTNQNSVLTGLFVVEKLS